MSLSMNRLLIVLRDPVAWILVIAGIVELLSGGTAARGAILFAGAALIMADRIRLVVARARARTGSGFPGRALTATRPRFSPAPLQAALESRRWMGVTLVAALAAALLGVHTLPLTAVTGFVGIVAVGWAWLTQPEDTTVQVSSRGLLIWGGVLLVLGLWELRALLGQPTLAESSYNSPTISYLLDPFFATYAGRVVGLGLWAWAGRSLIRRS
jgi:hypothetical protein